MKSSTPISTTAFLKQHNPNHHSTINQRSRGMAIKDTGVLARVFFILENSFQATHSLRNIRKETALVADHPNGLFVSQSLAQ